MRSILLVLVAVPFVCFARPLSSVPRLADIWEENQYIFPFVEDVPDQLLPDGVTDLIVAGVPTGELAMTVYLMGDSPDGPDVLASGPYNGEYNFAKSFAYWLPEDSLLEITFQMPFCARYAGATYEWVGSELIPVEWLQGDPSMEALQNVDSLLAIGEIGEAGNELSMMFYPGYYYDSGEMLAEFLRSAHTLGLERYQRGDPEGAAQLFNEIDQVSDILMVRYPWYRAWEDSSNYLESHLSGFMTIGEFTTIANDYGFFLEQSGDYEKAVDVLYAVLTLDPGRMVAYLNLGDALWGLQEYYNAVNEYMVYRDMMESVNLQDQVPMRVNRRIEEYTEPLDG